METTEKLTTDSKRKTDIIAISSGKGGTGKTLLTACFGYSLIRAGHRVLMIDADPATHGLSLFLLGREGLSDVKTFDIQNTFVGTILTYQQTEEIRVDPLPINRKSAEGHGIIYDNVLISTLGIYGDEVVTSDTHTFAATKQEQFLEAVRALFQDLRHSGQYDYVLIDTRGGFTFQSTDICALADSFIVVTDPDYTSFFQDRNLVSRISATAKKNDTKPVLRAFIVNRALDGEEEKFRLELSKEFPISFDETYPIPLDFEVMKAYKTQRIPYSDNDAKPTHFSYASLSAFSDILHVVTARWEEHKVDRWNEMINDVSKAIKKKNERIKKEAKMVEKRNPFRRAFFIATAILALSFVAFTSLFIQSRSQEDHIRLLADVYNSQIPTFRRLSTLQELYDNGYKSFPSINFSDSDLSGINLPLINFQSANLQGAKLTNANLSGANLRGTDLTFAILIEANLSGANVTNANLTEAILLGADLSYADLSGALLRSDLSGADLTGARVLSRQLSSAITNELSILPDGSQGPFKSNFLLKER